LGPGAGIGRCTTSKRAIPIAGNCQAFITVFVMFNPLASRIIAAHQSIDEYTSQ